MVCEKPACTCPLNFSRFEFPELIHVLRASPYVAEQKFFMEIRGSNYNGNFVESLQVILCGTGSEIKVPETTLK